MACPPLGHRQASIQSGFAAAVNQFLMQSAKKPKFPLTPVVLDLGSLQRKTLSLHSFFPHTHPSQTLIMPISHCFPRLFQLQHHLQDVENKVESWGNATQGHSASQGAEPAGGALVTRRTPILSVLLSALLKTSYKHSPALLLTAREQPVLST